MFLEHWATLELTRIVKAVDLEQQQIFGWWWVLSMKETV
jgi:hypothetical protein